MIILKPKKHEPIKMKSFKQEYSFEQRKAENDQIRQKFPNVVPVILFIDKIEQNYRRKYLVPSGFTMAQLMLYFREKKTISSRDGLYVMINDSVIPQMSLTIGELDRQHKSTDGFLYVSLFQESIFGFSCS